MIESEASSTPNKKRQNPDAISSTEALLGPKTKGATYLTAPKKQKKNMGNFIHGNYQAYYTHRRKQGDAIIDPRLDLIDKSYFENKKILDIGCNSGNISIAIARKYRIKSIHGVDIDENLIAKANTNLRVAHSLRDPNENPDSVVIDLSLKTHYFPLSMTNMFGFLPISIPPTYIEESSTFPFNVSFDVEDWANKTIEKYNEYDTILALSVTKWIQLHGGDKGLKSFFRKVYDSLTVGGTFVLEPQEFDTFQRRAKSIDPSINVNEEFKFRPEDYNDFLMNNLKFKECIDLGAPKSETKGFSRSIYLYIK